MKKKISPVTVVLVVIVLALAGGGLFFLTRDKGASGAAYPGGAPGMSGGPGSGQRMAGGPPPEAPESTGEAAEKSTAGDNETRSSEGRKRSESGSGAASADAPGDAPAEPSVRGGSSSPAGRSPRTAASSAAMAVEARPLAPGTITRRLKTNGEVLLAHEVAVYPDAAGKIVSYLVQPGDRLRSGQVLASVDPSKPGESYSASTVLAPLSGTVITTPVGRGSTVSTQTVLLTLSDLSQLKIESYIPERYSSQVAPGQPAILTFEAFPGREFPARLTRVSPVLDPVSRTLAVELSLENPQGAVKAGMFATAQIILEEKRNVPVIPRAAVLGVGDEKRAFVVNSQGTAEERFLVLGMDDGVQAEVLSGIALGEMVVTKGQTFIEEGDSLRVVNQ